MIKCPSNIIPKKKALFLFITLIFCGQFIVSCYKKPPQNEKDRFKASIDLITYQDKTIYFLYKINANDRYLGKYCLKKNIKGNNTLQNIIFELPNGIRPKNIRIDLGENESENDSIRIENISFQYKNCIINGDKGVYKSWFNFSKNVITGKDSLTFHLKRINNSFDPQICGNRKLNAKLVKLFPPDINEF